MRVAARARLKWLVDKLRPFEMRNVSLDATDPYQGRGDFVRHLARQASRARVMLFCYRIPQGFTQETREACFQVEPPKRQSQNIRDEDEKHGCIASERSYAARTQRCGSGNLPFLVAHNGSVLRSDDHLDNARNLFLSRLEWHLDGFDIAISDFEHHFKPMAERFQISYHLALTDYRPKVAILVSAYDHCLADLLYRHSTGELECDIIMVISNHPTAKRVAGFHGIPFHQLTYPKNKHECEREMLELLGQNVDLIVLARYMQILGPDFVAQYLLRMINRISITLSSRFYRSKTISSGL